MTGKTGWTWPNYSAVRWFRVGGIIVLLVLAATIPLLLTPHVSGVGSPLYPSSWPHEHYDLLGSNTAPTGGLTDPTTATAIPSKSYLDGFSFMTRGPSELYLLGGLLPPTLNYIAKLDPLNLNQIKRTSLDCPSSDCPFNYVWAGSSAIHANGYIYVTTESRLWKLDADINVVGYKNLPIKDGFYNSLKLLSDGNIIVKGVGLDGGTDQRSSLSIFTPNLDVVLADYNLPEQSIARISTNTRNNQEFVYIVGKTIMTRYRYTSGAQSPLVPDTSWSYKYRNATDADITAAGMATFIGNEAFFVDNAEQSPQATGPLHLYRVNLDNAADSQRVTPFPSTVAGFHLNKQLSDPINNVTVVADSNNTLVAGFRYLGNGNLVKLWQLPLRTKIIPSASSARSQLYITDMTRLGECVLVVNINTGQILNRFPTGVQYASETVIGIGYNNDIFYAGGPSTAFRIYNK